MASVNQSRFRRAVKQAANSIRNIAFPAARLRFLTRKRQMLEQIENHPISQEIMDGPDAENISGTLSGLSGPGHNLFSFIGFNYGSNPVGRLLDYLKDSIQIDKNQVKTRISSRFLIFSYGVDFPTISQIYDATPMPEWNVGRSWVKGIEKDGISGLASYIYWMKGLENPPSRSSGGFQAKVKGTDRPVILRSTVFKKTEYITPILKDFGKRIK